MLFGERVLFVPEPSNEGKERTDYHQPGKCLLVKSFSSFWDSSNTCHVLFSCDKNSGKEIPTAGERGTIRLRAGRDRWLSHLLLPRA